MEIQTVWLGHNSNGPFGSNRATGLLKKQWEEVQVEDKPLVLSFQDKLRPSQLPLPASRHIWSPHPDLWSRSHAEVPAEGLDWRIMLPTQQTFPNLWRDSIARSDTRSFCESEQRRWVCIPMASVLRRDIVHLDRPRVPRRLMIRIFWIRNSINFLKNHHFAEFYHKDDVLIFILPAIYDNMIWYNIYIYC